MAYLLITLANDPTVRPVGSAIISHLGLEANDLYTAFLGDSVSLARSVARVEVLVVGLHDSLLLACVQQMHTAATIAVSDMRPVALERLLVETLASGPVLLIGGDLPHLPLWRLRDALTYLEDGADVVIGPDERGGWYLIGLRMAHPALLRALPGYDDPLDDLCIAAATHGLRVEQLPAWYTLRTQADLDRLAADLSTMPRDVAPHTRRLLNDDGMRARAIGE
jgi:glycosyltransferase A (GT-A) superfamily protein (DUF2064 family)